MSKIIASSAIRGAHQIVRDAEDYLAKAIAAKGSDCAVGFPDTAYSLPVIYSLLGERVDRLSDMQKILDECHRLLPPVPSETSVAALSGRHSGCGHRHLVCLRNHRGLQVSHRPQPGRRHLAGRGQ